MIKFACSSLISGATLNLGTKIHQIEHDYMKHPTFCFFLKKI